ncbi:putative regulator of nonsense transcripts 3 [Blattamonas nauphoetae]|uniref:Regulator of nonsense transcripts 3 n=1 Tax=Blattamonas nauphoetae TaxID=2049346 RepID=A0ABQ9XIP8_9EUKA|nr:putative regulator of nonsense transcripts 3 [Blattamonas nauphoetae]
MPVKLLAYNIPPTYPEEQFWELTKEYLEWCNSRYFVKGRIGKHKKLTSRAYLTFVDQEVCTSFQNHFSGMTLSDAESGDWQMIVEIAPSQLQAPLEKNESSFNFSTLQIENDPDYLDFLKRLHEQDKETKDEQEPPKQDEEVFVPEVVKFLNAHVQEQPLPKQRKLSKKEKKRAKLQGRKQ